MCQDIKLVPVVNAFPDELVAIGKLGKIEGRVFVDTGAQVSILKRGASKAPMTRPDIILRGITGNTMMVYGRQKDTIYIRLGVTIEWNFVVGNLP